MLKNSNIQQKKNRFYLSIYTQKRRNTFILKAKRLHRKCLCYITVTFCKCVVPWKGAIPLLSWCCSTRYCRPTLLWVFSDFLSICSAAKTGQGKYLQLLDVHRALMQAVLPQGNVEMTGEPRLGQLQPAMELLQTGEQGEAEGGAVAALNGLGNLRFDGFSLPPFLLFIGWGQFRGN